MDANTNTASCYGGGDIAGAVFGTLFAVILLEILFWWLYRRHALKQKEKKLVTEDPENAKQEFAFDNPAFKNDGTKVTASPLDTKWTAKLNGSSDKRKTVDDTYANVPAPRLIALRGSDFTGLGIELCGGLKEGIFVKKVMTQGPGVGVVQAGDRITSLTIDFRHIVQEDAQTIMSYASPYNVQLELVDGKIPTATQSPQSGHSTLQHPLYRSRSSSNEDLNTIERNSRKQLSQNDNSNYPTLKMEDAQRISSSSPTNKPPTNMPTVHKENEKKNSLKQQVKDILEETFQSKSTHSSSTHEQTTDKGKQEVERKSSDDGKKGGLKFGIRVFPPAVNDMFRKSPTKVQSDNENNQNIEKNKENEKSKSPPEVKKRSKDKTPSSPAMVTVEPISAEFQRQGSITSSGIRRDAAGIPQEMPSHMMQAAMAAKDNRKSGSGLLSGGIVSSENRKSKGKAPRPPKVPLDELDASTDTIDTNVSMDTSMRKTGKVIDFDAIENLPEKTKKVLTSDKLNFSDNFADDSLNRSDDISYEKVDYTGSNISTPKSERKKSPSDTESQFDMNSDGEDSSEGGRIELNSSDITVHKISDEEVSEEGRKTASLGDLSKFENQKLKECNSNNGTLERAQSLDITDANTTANLPASAKKRKSTSGEDVILENKEPKLMNMDGMDTLQRGKLKSAYQWGNLEDLEDVYTATGHEQKQKYVQRMDTEENLEDIEMNEHEFVELDQDIHDMPISDTGMDFVKEVMAVADKFEAKTNEMKVTVEEEKKKPPPVPERRFDEKRISTQVSNDVVVIKNLVEKPIENVLHSQNGTKHIITVMGGTEHEETPVLPSPPEQFKVSIVNGSGDSHGMDQEVQHFLMEEARVMMREQQMGQATPEPTGLVREEVMAETMRMAPTNVNFKTDSGANRSSTTTTTMTTTTTVFQREGSSSPVTEQIQITNYETNVPDDVKVSRYPFGSLERPKSDVLKKLMAQKISSSLVPSSGHEEISLTTTTGNMNDMNSGSFNSADSNNMSSSVTVLDSNSFLEAQPISLTLINTSTSHNNFRTEEEMMENDQTESSQISPVYSSDNHGVNSISISSVELNVPVPEKRMENREFIIPSNKFQASDNVVTISTESSQPSSIILIDDDKLDFTLQTMDTNEKENQFYNGEISNKVNNNKTSSTMFTHHVTSNNNKNMNGGGTITIFEDSKKVATNEQDDEGVHFNDKLSESELNNINLQNFVTAITVKSINNAQHSVDSSLEDEDLDLSDNNNMIITTRTMTTTSNNTMSSNDDFEKSSDDDSEMSNLQSSSPPMKISSSSINFIKNEKRHNANANKTMSTETINYTTTDKAHNNNTTDSHIPRNAEIKFTTSTYETQPAKPSRLNQIEQIRSTFEKNNHSSEIPIPIRKSSIPTSIKTTPSKIPVFNSSKSMDNNSQRSPPTNSHNNHNTTNNTNNGRLLVSVTSIKSMSKHPSDLEI